MRPLPQPSAQAPADPLSAPNPKYTGHTFELRFEGCVDCHGSVEAAQGAIASAQASIKSQIKEVVTLLDNWATNKAPADLQTNYNKLAWEVLNPGRFIESDQ